MTEQTQPWPGLKYAPLRGLTDRLLARWLRTQRKNMRRFFAERGMFDELEQMERIKRSRQGTVAKNQMFKEVLDAYAARATAQSAPKTASVADDGGVDVRDAVPPDDGADRNRRDAGISVPEVEGVGGSEPVIEE